MKLINRGLLTTITEEVYMKYKIEFNYRYGQDKQKVITDMWDKYRANKESVRVNITAIKIFE